MRTITDHKLNGLNECIEINADGPGPGGASHRYNIELGPPGRPVQVAAQLSFHTPERMKRDDPLIEWCAEGDGLRFTKRGLFFVVPLEITLLAFAIYCLSQP